MAAIWKVHMVLTKYFMCINWGHYVICLQNIKFVQLLLRPGGAYTNTTHAAKGKIMIPYCDEIMNHDYIGSFWQCQMSQKTKVFLCFLLLIVFFFCCEKVFLVFFSSKCTFFLYYAGKSQVLQIFITISEFLRTSLINFPQNLVLLLRGQ